MRKRALCIGINDYPGTQNDLLGCENDADDWAKELGTFGFDSVHGLINSGATKKEILRSIKEDVAGLTSGDLFVMTYSGHGSFVPDQDNDESDERDECLCPYDIMDGFIIDDELHQAFLPVSKLGVNIILISDSCHSGTVLRMFRTPDEAEGVARVRFLPPSVFYQSAMEKNKPRKELPHPPLSPFLQSAAPKRRQKPSIGVLFAGCQDSEYSYDAQFSAKPNGAFTYFALKALKALKVTNTVVTYRQWYNAIRKFLPNQSYPQRPNLQGTKGMLNQIVFGGIATSVSVPVSQGDCSMTTTAPVAAPKAFKDYAAFLAWVLSAGIGNVPTVIAQVKIIIAAWMVLVGIFKKPGTTPPTTPEIPDSGLQMVYLTDEEKELEAKVLKAFETHAKSVDPEHQAITKALGGGAFFRNIFAFIQSHPELSSLLWSVISGVLAGGS